MWQLLLLNFIIISIIFAVLFILKKYIKTEKGKNILLLVSSVLTILCHYSILLYLPLTGNDIYSYVCSNPNLILPIYPCNLVMWCCLLLALLKNKKSKLGRFLIDFIFYFGVVSCIVGLFANVDFIRNPSLSDFHVTKGILAHGFMFFNCLVLPFFGFVEVNLNKNLPHIIESIILMLITGLYVNLIFEVVGSKEYMYNVNSMFLIHSPFGDEGVVKYLTYPFISLLALLFYFGLFNILELIKYEKGNRWFNRLQKGEL